MQPVDMTGVLPRALLPFGAVYTLRPPAVQPLSPAPSAAVAIASLWTDLASGRFEILHAGTPNSTSALLLRKLPRPGAALSDEDARIVERVLSGDPQKAIAIDLGVSCGAVSGRLGRGLRGLGLARSAVPLVIAALVCSRTIGVPLPPVRCEHFIDGGLLHLAMSLPSPTLASARWLTAAQRQVACMLLEGQSRADMAARRATSARTIAVQLTAMYSSMRASGRYGLLRRVLTEGLW